MAYPNIVFNNSTGSDTQASGAGPTTAVFGTGASLSSSTSVNLSADSPDLSGVATDGSACLWVLTSSGRQFSKITGVDNGTKIVTVETAYGVTESGRTWAIGGKRSTLHDTNSILLLTADARTGWKVELQYTGTNYMHRSSGSGGITITANAGGSYTQRGLIIYGTGAQQPTLELRPGTPGTALVLQDGCGLKNLKLYMIYPGDIYTTAIYGYSNIFIIGCYFTNDGNGHYCYIKSQVGLAVRNCVFENLTSVISLCIIIDNAVPASYTISHCYFYNTRVGIYSASAYVYQGVILNNIFHNNSFAGVILDSGGSTNPNYTVINNTFYGNGIGIVVDDEASAGTTIAGNIITNSTTYGIDMSVIASQNLAVEDYNVFYNNTSGSISNSISVGPNSVEGVNPNFEDPSNKNMKINNSAVAGIVFDTGLLYSTTLNIDPGATQSNFGGTGFISVGTRGGFVN